MWLKKLDTAKGKFDTRVARIVWEATC